MMKTLSRSVLRYSLLALILGLSLSAQPKPQGPPAKYEPTWDSIKRHVVPQWFEDAKFGIFIHWGLYSVPAWAPPTGEFGKVDRSQWFYKNPYAEWYLNSIRLEGTPTWKHHIETYGKNFGYLDFIPIFNQEVRKWKPDQWAALFKEVGARYVVLTSKHHDGFTLWPSDVPNPHRRPDQRHASRDLVGELTRAVRAQGLKMGLYYSGGLDWSFTEQPIRTSEDVRGTAPQSEEYARYADAHWRELIDHYQPSILWNDITYPKKGDLLHIFADYYNRQKDGVINNRFGVEFSDFTTPEYAKYEQITPKKWESCRGLGYSFGYNQVEGPKEVLSPDALVDLLVDIVSKNGNLLLNIGPKADGTIPEIQVDRLRALGKWLAVNGEGIFATRPWIRPSSRTADGVEVRFTRKPDAVYAFLLSRPKSSAITIESIYTGRETTIQLLGTGSRLKWSQQGKDLRIELPASYPDSYAYALKISPAPWQVVKE